MANFPLIAKITISVTKEDKSVPMTDPIFKICPHCSKSGTFIDRKNPAKRSPTFYSKEDSLSWLKRSVSIKYITKEQGEDLARSVLASKLAETTAEYLAKHQQAEPCTEN